MTAHRYRMIWAIRTWKALKAAGLISGFCLCGLLMYHLYASWALDLPSIAPLKTTEGLRTQVTFDDGSHAPVVLIPLHEIPPHVANAFIVAQDSTYFTDKFFGGGLFAARAADLLLRARSYAAGRRYGHADRLHLQLNVMLFLSREETAAVELATTYFGKNAYGISAAAQVYYDKPLLELNLCEATMLASLPQGPFTYNPVKYPERAKEQQRSVLEKMVRLGLASDAEMQACK